MLAVREGLGELGLYAFQVEWLSAAHTYWIVHFCEPFLPQAGPCLVGWEKWVCGSCKYLTDLYRHRREKAVTGKWGSKT